MPLKPDSKHCQSYVETEDSLEKLGYKQELTRNRGLFHILFMTLAIIAVPYGLTAPLATSLVGGGPVTVLWGWVAVSVLTLPLAFSLAEISSKYPTSAGAYYWCFRLASPPMRLLFSWINGWLSMVGVWTIALSVNFGVSQFLVAGIEIYHPQWVASAWQTYLVFLAFTAFTSIVCIFFNDVLPTLDLLSAFWTLIGVIIILISISATASAGRHSISFALGHFDASPSGWAPGWGFCVGLLAPGKGYLCPRSILYSPDFCSLYLFRNWHDMAEEVRNPTKEVPRAIVWSIPISTFVGLLFLLPIVFTLPDISVLLSVTSGQPTGLMFELMMGSKAGGFGMWFLVFGVGVFCAISICCAASRATWAFARDKALPFCTIFSRVNRLTGIPLNAFLLSTVVQVLLALLYLGSTAAFNAFVGVAATCLGASYAMPVAISLFNGRRNLADAPFHLGIWGVPLNVIAILWVMFEIVLYSIPAVIPVTRTSMNYASVVFIGFAVISGVWYLINGRFQYTGPPVPALDQVDDANVRKDAIVIQSTSAD